MKRILAIAVAIVLLFTVLPPTALADELENPSSGARLMPVSFTYTDTVHFDSDFTFPPGHANFVVIITGTVDVQSGNYVSISSAECHYSGGYNISVHDMEIVATANYTNGTVTYQLFGEVTYSWTDPFLGIQLETSEWQSDVITFDAVDYI